MLSRFAVNLCIANVRTRLHETDTARHNPGDRRPPFDLAPVSIFSASRSSSLTVAALVYRYPRTRHSPSQITCGHATPRPSRGAARHDEVCEYGSRAGSVRWFLFAVFPASSGRVSASSHESDERISSTMLPPTCPSPTPLLLWPVADLEGRCVLRFCIVPVLHRAKEA